MNPTMYVYIYAFVCMIGGMTCEMNARIACLFSLYTTTQVILIEEVPTPWMYGLIAVLRGGQL